MVKVVLVDDELVVLGLEPPSPIQIARMPPYARLAYNPVSQSEPIQVFQLRSCVSLTEKPASIFPQPYAIMEVSHR